MRTYKCDVLVVGGGPAGGSAGKSCAERGLDTIIIEKKAEIGAPLRCAEGVSKKMFKEVGIEPRPEWICADMKGAVIKSPDGTSFELDESKAGAEVGYVLNRNLFDKGINILATEAGAKTMLRTWMYDFIRKDGKIVGAKCKQMGEDIEIYCDVVVGADGVESQVGRWAGMDTNLKLADIEPCLQYRMSNCDCSMEFCEFILGLSVAPGGYLWIFPKGNGIANVGIGIAGTFAKNGVRPKQFLDKFIAEDPRFKNAQIIEIDAGFDSTCPGLEDGYSVDNVLLVGDSARLIDPLTGGGIGHALISGMYAGEVIAECKKKGDFSREALKAYDRKIQARMEDGLYRDWMAKERLATLDDDTINQLVKLISTANIEHVNVQNLLIAIKDKFPKVVEGFEDLI
ncbi:geranylgeranyl reductase family [Thermoplasmatales archaeon BRNA1]|nr:geranylgeranyl reductase family [Thermoplasmatales archaeon BRNA1]